MIRRYIISPPFFEQPGDTYVKNGSFVEQWRGTILVASRDLRLMDNTEIEHPLRIGPIPVTNVLIEERNPMEAATATVVGVTLNGDNYNFQFSDGSGTPRTLEQLQNEAAELQVSELAQKIQRVMAFHRSNGGANMTSQNGTCCTLDFQADNPVSFSS